MARFFDTSRVDQYVLTITIIGIAALGMAWFPEISRRSRVSYALMYVVFGMLIYFVLGKYLDPIDPVNQGTPTVHLTELVILISLMGTGLKIDQPFSFRSWRIPFRLITLTMLLCIAGMASLAHFLLGFDWASSILLGAVLAPTDPVLAADVQVEPPMEGRKENVRFSLTAEAGMNDGAAFPFVWLAILLAGVGLTSGRDWAVWIARDVLYKLVAGVACGILLGRLLAYLVFSHPEKRKVIVIKDGFVAVAATLLVYGITEILHGYGFIAVFIAAITLRNFELNHKYHKKLHEFTDQVKRILISVVLIAFGGALVNGVLQPLNWKMVIAGVVFIVMIRPLSALTGMIGTRLRLKEKLVISFFGIRGIGSFYYLAFALTESNFRFQRELWAAVSFIVLLSIIIHGLTAGNTIASLEKEAEEELENKSIGKRIMAKDE